MSQNLDEHNLSEGWASWANIKENQEDVNMLQDKIFTRLNGTILDLTFL